MLKIQSSNAIKKAGLEMDITNTYPLHLPC